MANHWRALPEQRSGSDCVLKHVQVCPGVLSGVYRGPWLGVHSPPELRVSHDIELEESEIRYLDWQKQLLCVRAAAIAVPPGPLARPSLTNSSLPPLPQLQMCNLEADPGPQP